MNALTERVALALHARVRRVRRLVRVCGVGARLFGLVPRRVVARARRCRPAPRLLRRRLRLPPPRRRGVAAPGSFFF
ncbi:unnamed protein product, partial [Iphiclides podalirius]